MRRAMIMLVMLLGCGGGSAAVSPSRPGAVEADASIPPELRQQVARSSELGRELYIQDKVAAMGTDVAFAHIRDVAHAGIAGYIQLREGDGRRGTGAFLVLFYTPEQPPRVRYEVRFAPDAPPSFKEHTPPRPGPEGFTSLAQARQLVIEAMPANREQPLNTVLMPGEALGESGILVYLLAGTRRHNLAVLGRHYRALVAPDIGRVSYIQPLSSSILEIPTVDPSGKPVEGLGVSHHVTDYPLETHVFASLLYELPIFVTTRRGLWKVDGERITLASAGMLL